MDKELQLKTDSNLNFSVNTQLKEQLKWLIGLDEIAPGDMLPSANQLADSLELNRNTVNLVYTQLRDEGLLSMHKGRGTQVMNNAKIEELRKNRQAMQQAAVKVMEETAAHKIPLTDFFVAGLAYALLQNPAAVEGTQIAFIECREHDHFFYRDEIKRVTKAAVVTIPLEELAAQSSTTMEVLRHANVVITTLNHADEVKHLLTGANYEKPVHVIGATIAMPLLLEIAACQPGSKVSFVCLGKAGGQWMARNIHDAGITQIEPLAVGVDNREQLLEVLGYSDKIYASAAVYEELKAMAPDKVSLYPMVLEKSSENMLMSIADK